MCLVVCTVRSMNDKINFHNFLDSLVSGHPQSKIKAILREGTGRVCETPLNDESRG